MVDCVFSRRKKPRRALQEPAEQKAGVENESINNENVIHLGNPFLTSSLTAPPGRSAPPSYSVPISPCSEQLPSGEADRGTGSILATVLEQISDEFPLVDLWTRASMDVGVALGDNRHSHTPSHSHDPSGSAAAVIQPQVRDTDTSIAHYILEGHHDHHLAEVMEPGRQATTTSTPGICGSNTDDLDVTDDGLGLGLGLGLEGFAPAPAPATTGDGYVSNDSNDGYDNYDSYDATSGSFDL
jgi:hypothetical protein